MLTRCPHCQTAFRVTPEQLKARQGRVRCGECRAVFDALDTLADEAPSLAAAPHLPTEDPVVPTTEATDPPLAPEPVIEAEFASDPELLAETTSPEPPSHPPPAGNEAVEAAAAPGTDPEAPPPEQAAPDDPPVQENAEDADNASPTGPLSTDEVIEAEEPAPWERPDSPPPKRWPWLIGLLALLVLAVGQLLFIFRVELAVLVPELRPALAAGCELLGCTLPRPRKPELIGIEASDLAPADGDRLLLTATLKNRAPFDQEYPHLELTLTDTQDAALLRKVLTPADYLPKGRQPGDGFLARDEQAVKLTLAAPGVPAAGYRLYLFYP